MSFAGLAPAQHVRRPVQWTAFQRRRQNRLVAAGYTVLRFTWDDVTRRQSTVSQIRTALAQAPR